jgi:hypothetical protein
MARRLRILFGIGRSWLRTRRELALENLALRQQCEEVADEWEASETPERDVNGAAE